MERAITKSSAKKKFADLKKNNTGKAPRRKQSNWRNRNSLKSPEATLLVKHFAGLYHFELPENWGKQKAKSKGGRPTIITDKVLRELELAFAYDCTVEEACILAGITPFTYYEFLKKQPKFSHTVALLRNVPILIARQTIVNGVHSSQDSARYYLERKVKSEFSPKLQLAHEGEIKHNHAISEETEQAIENIFTLFEKTALEVDDDTVDEK